MIKRTIKVKVMDKSPNRVTISLRQSNGRMIIPRDVFEKRVKAGIYEVFENK